MDTKITLSFDADTIGKAKQFAEANNMSLSGLTEFLYRNIAKKNYRSLEELPLADWVNMVSEGEAEYETKYSRKQRKAVFYQSQLKK